MNKKPFASMEDLFAYVFDGVGKNKFDAHKVLDFIYSNPTLPKNEKELMKLNEKLAIKVGETSLDHVDKNFGQKDQERTY